MRNTKNWLALLLCVLMLVNTLGITASAVQSESPIGLSVTYAADGTVQLQILASEARTVADGKLVLTYDAEKLAWLDAEPGAAWGDSEFFTWSHNPNEGALILTFASAEAAAEGVLFTVTFEAAGDAVIAIDGSRSYISDVTADLSQEISTCPSAHFEDLTGFFPEAHEALDFMVANDYMNGMSAAHFAPHMELNRAMMVTILHRIAGEPPVEGDPAFADVPAGVFCSDAVVWASANGITNGVSANLFAPTKALTRAELVTFLYRFAGVMGYDRTATTDLSGYTDASLVLDSFAGEAFAWAVAEGVIKGTSDTTLSPAATTTRAQVCLMGYRLLSAQD